MEQFIGMLAGLMFGLFPPMGASLVAENSLELLRVLESSAVHEPHATILFGGDLMFDRSIRRATQRQGDDHVFSCLSGLLHDSSVDVVVANLEGPITPYDSMSLGSVVGSPENFTFTFPTSTATLLKRHRFDIVNLGNNHIMNFGRDGASQTKFWLEKAGVLFFGDPLVGEAERVLRTDIKGIPFSFVNWSDWTSDNTDITAAQITAEANEGRVVVVYTHWGDEYVPPTARVRRLAHSFVDAGAAIIIGSHPHVIQEVELYNGVYIYYSLGNFVFDQYWDDEVRTGLMVRASFTKDGVVAVDEELTYLMRDGRTCPLRLLSAQQ